MNSAASGSQLLQDLVSIPSPSGEEAAAVRFLVSAMQSLGFTSAYQDLAGNAIGLMGGGSRQIVLLGHIDTVPGEIPVRVVDGKLFGRGAVDAKGPLAAMVEAVGLCGELEGWQLVLVGAVGEEADSPGTRFILDAYRPEFLIVGEPSQWDRVTLGYKGIARAGIRVLQPQAHPAADQATASERAIAAWSEVVALAESLNQDRAGMFDQVQPSVQAMDSGDDGHTTWAFLEISTRLPVDCPPQTWYQALQEAVNPLEVTRLGFPTPAYRAGKQNKLVRAFLSAIRAQGGEPRFVNKSGTADFNLAAPYWGCPAVAYGPGDARLDHTPDEHLSLSEYAQAVQVLAKVIQQVVESSG